MNTETKVNSFVQAIEEQEARTDNDMKARKYSADANMDLFFKIGASRGQDIIPAFVAAFVENPDYAVRIAQWARDIRGGAGERQLFKDILGYIEKEHTILAMKLISNIPNIGRWDDMLIEYTNPAVKEFAYKVYGKAIMRDKEPLAAKWAPRKGKIAVELRKAWEMSPKQYRKTLVNLTNVVETAMCAKKWDTINFSHVPSLASARYKSAFYRNSEEAFTAYVEGLATGETKVNAGAVYPYDVIKGMYSSWGLVTRSETEINHMIAQWDALENYMGNADVFPMIDVSGSMCCVASGSTTCLDVAVSLGLYCADKNTGKFKDAFLTFSESPEIVQLKGTIYDKLVQVNTSNWGMNTNLHAAFERMLKMAINANVPSSEMPGTLLILSDMQFDYCTNFDDSAFEMIQRKYADSGYVMPNIVFWNLSSHDNIPVRFDTKGTALISGFSPAIMKAVLKADMEDFTPLNIMLDTIMVSRYEIS